MTSRVQRETKQFIEGAFALQLNGVFGRFEWRCASDDVIELVDVAVIVFANVVRRLQHGKRRQRANHVELVRVEWRGLAGQLNNCFQTQLVRQLVFVSASCVNHHIGWRQWVTKFIHIAFEERHQLLLFIAEHLQVSAQQAVIRCRGKQLAFVRNGEKLKSLCKALFELCQVAVGSVIMELVVPVEGVNLLLRKYFVAKPLRFGRITYLVSKRNAMVADHLGVAQRVGGRQAFLEQLPIESMCAVALALRGLPLWLRQGAAQPGSCLAQCPASVRESTTRSADSWHRFQAA